MFAARIIFLLLTNFHLSKSFFEFSLNKCMRQSKALSLLASIVGKERVNTQNALVSHMNWEEYPNDDYSHILGYGNSSHIPSKLQSIMALRIKDVKRSKEPIDAVRLQDVIILNAYNSLFSIFINSLDVELIRISIFHQTNILRKYPNSKKSTGNL